MYDFCWSFPWSLTLAIISVVCHWRTKLSFYENPGPAGAFLAALVILGSGCYSLYRYKKGIIDKQSTQVAFGATFLVTMGLNMYQKQHLSKAKLKFAFMPFGPIVLIACLSLAFYAYCFTFSTIPAHKKAGKQAAADEQPVEKKPEEKKAD